jgi:hypothetical protein
MAMSLTLLSGCAPYRLQGIVMEGTTPAVAVVEANDPRLTQRGLEGAALNITLDPTGMAPKTVGTTVTDMDGRFSLRVDEVGIGVLEYEVGILGQATGYRDLWKTLPAPKKDQHLLIIMAPGAGGERSGDLLRDTMRIHDDLMKAQ